MGSGEVIAAIVGCSGIIIAAVLRLVPNRNGKCDGEAYVTRDLCDERSRNINEATRRIEHKMDQLLKINGDTQT